MGYIRHDAIVVTAWDKERISKAHKKAKEIGLTVSEIISSPINGYLSFLIAPDGSKEGWKASDTGIEQRDTWKAWAKQEEDLWVDWVHIHYGGDDPEVAIIEDHYGKEITERIRNESESSK